MGLDRCDCTGFHRENGLCVCGFPIFIQPRKVWGGIWEGCVCVDFVYVNVRGGVGGVAYATTLKKRGLLSLCLFLNSLDIEINNLPNYTLRWVMIPRKPLGLFCLKSKHQSHGYIHTLLYGVDQTRHVSVRRCTWSGFQIFFGCPELPLHRLGREGLAGYLSGIGHAFPWCTVGLRRPAAWQSVEPVDGRHNPQCGGWVHPRYAVHSGRFRGAAA